MMSIRVLLAQFLEVMKGFAALQGNAPVHLLVVIRNYLVSTE